MLSIDEIKKMSISEIRGYAFSLSYQAAENFKKSRDPIDGMAASKYYDYVALLLTMEKTEREVWALREKIEKLEKTIQELKNK